MKYLHKVARRAVWYYRNDTAFRAAVQLVPATVAGALLPFAACLLWVAVVVLGGGVT